VKRRASDRDGVTADHETSLAVWDVPSPVVAGRRATLKVGIACACGCDLTGTRIDVYDEAGERVGGGDITSGTWPATDALYWTACDVAAPASEGEHDWDIRATVPGASHGHLATVHRFVASGPPEHRVTLEVIDKGSGAPVGGVELRLGRFRATTDDAGVAHVEVARGSYEVCAWKIGYDLLSTTVIVSSDETTHLEVTPAPETEQPYWM
jgi:hypothetical protein